MPLRAIQLSRRPPNGDLEVDPKTPSANPGDIVQWSSVDGDVKVSFPSDGNPFNNGNVFQAKRGTLTPPAVVSCDVKVPGHFICTITVEGKDFVGVVGIDTPGS